MILWLNLDVPKVRLVAARPTISVPSFGVFSNPTYLCYWIDRILVLLLLLASAAGSVATVWLKLAEPAEPSRAKPGHQIGS
jgi:hypothetical protein